MKKRLLTLILLAALLVFSRSAWAINTYCTTAMQTTSGVCLTNGSQPALNNVSSGLVTIPWSFNIANTVSAAGLANTDVLKLVPTPGVANQCDLLDIHFDTPALDTGGGLTAKIGDGGSSNRYVTTASTAFQGSLDTALASLNAFVAQSLPHAYTATDTIIVTFTHSNTTPATSGIMAGWATFYCGANPAIGG